MRSHALPYGVFLQVHGPIFINEGPIRTHVCSDVRLSPRGFRLAEAEFN